VIDASDAWERTRDRVMTEIAPTAPQIQWLYEPAEQRSITLQRNQGLKRATADIAFLIDDDSLMYPTCAEAIMQVYEADPEGIVAGVQAIAVENPPIAGKIADERKQAAPGSEITNADGNWRNVIRSWLWRHVFLMDACKLFLPYDTDSPNHPVPVAVARLNVCQTALFQGYRMTFRRSVITQESFEPLLRYYAAGEDLDASYRASRHGCLLTALDGKLHHYQSAGGRLPRFKIAVLSAMNQALCIRKHSENLVRCKYQYYFLISRRVIAESMKDAFSRRWSLPQARGLLVALRYSRQLFSLPDHELGEWYVQFQQKLLGIS
jgi:GT2 family glycosyltransferase